MVTIEILTREGCAFCPAAMEICKKVASEFEDVEIIETSIDTEEGEQKAAALGVVAVPTILIDGEPKITGVPREEILREEIKLFRELEKQ